MHDETLEHQGYTFRVAVEHDETMGEPWKEHDGHGVVSDWTTRSKAPGERVLIEDRGSFRYYDYAETVKIALKDGWGCRDGHVRTSPRETAAQATHEDYQRMRDWCEGRWTWVGVVVTLLDTDGEPTRETASLWGIESDSGDDCLYDEVARELADEIIDRIDKADVLTRKVRA